ncbi:MAG: DnaJ domain-containing protein [Phycisphaerales bacterium]
MSQDAEDPPAPRHATHEDPFDALGLPPGFDTDPADVERAYLARAAAIHPDLAAPDPLVQADAARRSARLNAARETLLDPERRAVALLARLGGAPAADDRALPDGFLMEMMQTRVQIEEELDEDADAARPRWLSWASDRRRERIDRVRDLFLARAQAPDPAILADIRRELNAWRYIERLVEQLDPDHAPARRERDA